MTARNQRLLIRCAIYSSLLVWLSATLTQMLPPFTLRPAESGLLAIGAITGLAALVLWPWLREPRQSGAEARDDTKPERRRQHQERLVTVELLALSAILLNLLWYIP